MANNSYLSLTGIKENKSKETKIIVPCWT